MIKVFDIVILEIIMKVILIYERGNGRLLN